MQSRLMTCVFGAALAFATPDLLAHGGIYRGPADTVPQPPDGRSHADALAARHGLSAEDLARRLS